MIDTIFLGIFFIAWAGFVGFADVMLVRQIISASAHDRGGLILAILFIMPFNGAAVMPAAVLREWMSESISPSPAGGVKLIDDGHTILARLSPFSARAVALLGCSVTAILSMFLAAAIFGTKPSTPTALLSLIPSILAIPIFGIAWARIERNGRWDLVVDRSARIVRLPPSSRAISREISFDAIRWIGVLRVTMFKMKTTYALWIKLTNGTGVEVTTVAFEAKAIGFAQWLLDTANASRAAGSSAMLKCFQAMNS